MLILLGILLGMFVLMALGTLIVNKYSRKNAKEELMETPVEIPLDCCGAHEVCEFEEMLKNPEEIVYYEDEDLDRYRGMASDQYNDQQIEEFRDVLYTLHSEEIRKWLLSIERRNIQLPSILKQEAFQLLTEA
ncbi:hypothetical protein [Gaoshiqia sp. Z1-71]|uniref:hypothetical protein n=1 Tax=Gaoshiqia hydrogeniformans TaxID=3290090 RepID=UPI003BF84DD0